MLLKKTIALALTALCANAMAADYFVVTPVKSNTVGGISPSPSSVITVTLAPTALPGAEIGASYRYDFNQNLQVTGDPGYTGAGVTWAVSAGTLPDGFNLDANTGVLSGAPVAEGSNTFEISAAYKTKSGATSYQVTVATITVSLAGTTLSHGKLGAAYSYDFNPLLSVQHDGSYAGSGATWSLAAGTLPAGLALDNAAGTVSGTPSVAGTASFTMQVSYKGKSATQSFSLPVDAADIVASGTTRTWSDGTLAASCNEYRTGKAGYVYAGTVGDGIYRIDVDGAGPLTATDVLCDMTTDGGGWTVIQSRKNGAVDFYRTYAEYAAGFGTAATEYWLGNDRLAALTATGKSLRFDLQRKNGQTGYALYSGFKVSPAADGYRLSVTYVSGTVGDSFQNPQNGMRFSAKDKDQDSAAANCSTTYRGAWWYNTCHQSNLNGAYLNGTHTTYADGMEWNTWTGYYESLVVTKMKVR